MPLLNQVSISVAVNRQKEEEKVVQSTRNTIGSLEEQEEQEERKDATFTGDFADEIELEAAVIRTGIVRTTQLRPAEDQAKHAGDISHGPMQHSLQRLSASALYGSLPVQNMCAEDDNGDEEDAKQDEDTEIDSADMGSDGGYESEGFGGYSEDSSSESEGLQLELGEDASNRAINASKARVIQSAMLANLIRLNFREDITRAALEAGFLEIDHYDSDCELAYVDIFMSLVKMVCDAHVEGDDVTQSWTSPDRNSGDHVRAAIADENPPSSLKRHSCLPFKWPVFDMAQFELKKARPGTCMDSVCVLTNLPQVSMDRTQELMEVLSCNLFCMIGDPIQVIVPSGSDTGRTKGHAFLEFDNPDIAQKCALAVDGLTWGKGFFGKIRGKLFRQYQDKGLADRWARVRSDHRAAIPRWVSSESFPDAAPIASPTFEHHDSRKAERFRLGLGAAPQQTLACEIDDDGRDTGEWVARHPLQYAQSTQSLLLEVTSGSAGIFREQYEPIQHDIVMQLGCEDKFLNGENSAEQRREVERDDDNDESFDSSSVLEFQGFDEEKLMDHFVRKELVHEYPPTRIPLSQSEVQAASSTVALIAPASCGMTMQSYDAHESNDVINKAWRRYCEDVMLRNCEMQESIASAHRRIVQLSHNNEKLHLLVDRVEQDRDGLLYENNVLQTQLYGYKDHEQHHDSLMKELVLLRKRVAQNKHAFGMGLHQFKAPCSVDNAASSLSGIEAGLLNIDSVSFATCKIDELKQWERQLESTLSHVRSIKEGRALEMQQKLDRQVEEQNELKLCVICLSNEKSILCLPCRHLCLCKTCSHRQEVIKCPICRLDIKEMLAVYS